MSNENKMGICGAALATVLGYTLSMVISFLLLTPILPLSFLVPILKYSK